MKVLFAIFLFLCLRANASFANENIKFIEYRDAVSKIVLSYDFDGKVFSNGHIITDIDTCPDSSDLICIIAGVPFVVPKYFDPSLKSWSYDKYQFINHGEETLKLFGESYKVYRIEYPEDDGALWYLYSIERGVLMLGSMKNQKIENAFTLQNEYGIGKAKDQKGKTHCCPS